MALSKQQIFVAVAVIVLCAAAAWKMGLLSAPAFVAADCSALSGEVPVRTAAIDSQEKNRVDCYRATNCIYDDASATCSDAPTDSKDNVKTGVKYNCYLGDTGNCLEHDHCDIIDDECRPK